MFNHMQLDSGRDFRDPLLDLAYKELIENDNTVKSTKNAISATLNTFGSWDRGLTYKDFELGISQSYLPIFDRLLDRFNGLGISVHQVNSTKITLKKLQFQGNKYTATLLFTGQDHFGLDITDINKFKFRYLTIFRIWFVLQRYEKLNYKPFFVNMSAEIVITGENNVQ